jgi:hypothetical protein
VYWRIIHAIMIKNTFKDKMRPVGLSVNGGTKPN